MRKIIVVDLKQFKFTFDATFFLTLIRTLFYEAMMKSRINGFLIKIKQNGR